MFGVILGLGIAIAFYVGICRNEWIKEGVGAGAMEYVMDPKTGDTDWRWTQCEGKP